MGELEIPVEAIRITADHCFGERKQMSEAVAREIAEAALEDAAPVIVAAELRRLAVEMYVTDGVRLLKRAKELDPQRAER